MGIPRGLCELKNRTPDIGEDWSEKMNPHEEIKQFVKERDEAFLSLNEELGLKSWDDGDL